MQKRYSPIKPVDFGELKDPVRNRFGAYRHHGSHAGIDIYKDRHTPLRAVLDGKVVRANGKEGHSSYGGLVIIDHTPERKLGQEPFLRLTTTRCTRTLKK